MKRFSCNACGKCCSRFYEQKSVTVTLSEMINLYDKVLLLGNIYFNGPTYESVRYISDKYKILDQFTLNKIQHFLQSNQTSININQPPYSLSVQAQLVMVPFPDGRCPLLRDNACSAYTDRPYVCRLYPLTSWLPVDIAEAVTNIPDDCQTNDSAPPFIDGSSILDPGYRQDLEGLDRISASRKLLTDHVLSSPEIRNHLGGFIKGALAGRRDISTDIISFIEAAVHLGVLKEGDKAEMVRAQLSLATERIHYCRENKIKQAREMMRQLDTHVARYRKYLDFISGSPVQ